MSTQAGPWATAPAPIAPDPARDAAFAELIGWLQTRRVHMGVNIGLMNRPGSPVFRRIEMSLPLFTVAAGTIVALPFGGPHLAFLCLVLGGIGFFFMALPRIKARVYDRTMQLVSNDRAAFEHCWKVGALSLQDAHHPDNAMLGGTADWASFRPRPAAAAGDAPA